MPYLLTKLCESKGLSFVATPTTCTSGCAFANATTSGASWLHGPHQEAKKLMTVGFPLTVARSKVPPLSVLPVSVWAEPPDEAPADDPQPTTASAARTRTIAAAPTVAAAPRAPLLQPDI